jgi:protoheme IX farnesyltransferase
MEPPLASETVLDTAALRSPPAPRTWCAAIDAYLELGKARLSALVVLTTAVGYLVAADGAIDWLRFGTTLIGTTFAAWGANAINQWLEAERDARMFRTRARPIPAGRIAPAAALAFGVAFGALGPAILLFGVGAAASALALGTLMIYVLIYTPMKIHTPLNTLVGAVVGAIPPLIGWVASAGRLEWGGWIIAGVLFLWQIPHFLALAWTYREDYARGGFKMLPNVDASGRLTGLVVVMYSLLLVPIGAALALSGNAGSAYLCGAIVLGILLTALGVGLERHRTDAAARRLFFGSLIYLPLLLGLMVVDRRVPEAPRMLPRIDPLLAQPSPPASRGAPVENSDG